MESPVVSSVTHDPNTAVIKIYPIKEAAQAFFTKLFERLAEKGIVVDIITQSHNEQGHRLAFSVPADDLLIAEEL